MVRVDDVTKWAPLGQRLHGCYHLVAHRRRPGVHQHHTLLAGLDGDVPTSAGNHVDVALHRQNLDLARSWDFELLWPRCLRTRRSLSTSPCSTSTSLRVDGMTCKAKEKNAGGESSQCCISPCHDQFPPSPTPVATFAGLGIAFIFAMYS